MDEAVEVTLFEMDTQDTRSRDIIHVALGSEYNLI